MLASVGFGGGSLGVASGVVWGYLFPPSRSAFGFVSLLFVCGGWRFVFL